MMCFAMCSLISRSGYGLRHSSVGIGIPIVFAATSQQNAAHFLNFSARVRPASRDNQLLDLADTWNLTIGNVTVKVFEVLLEIL